MDNMALTNMSIKAEPHFITVSPQMLRIADYKRNAGQQIQSYEHLARNEYLQNPQKYAFSNSIQ